jgi:hypothetical protein
LDYSAQCIVNNLPVGAAASSGGGGGTAGIAAGVAVSLVAVGAAVGAAVYWKMMKKKKAAASNKAASHGSGAASPKFSGPGTGPVKSAWTPTQVREGGGAPDLLHSCKFACGPTILLPLGSVPLLGSGCSLPSRVMMWLRDNDDVARLLARAGREQRPRVWTGRGGTRRTVSDSEPSACPQPHGRQWRGAPADLSGKA